MERDGNNFEKLCQIARRLASMKQKTYFVVCEPDHLGAYHVASEFDLDTWFQGIRDSAIRYCTADDTVYLNTLRTR